MGGRLDVGINACEHLAPDPDLLATEIREAMARLLELTREAARSAAAGER
ncbi:WSD1 family O-acyltransferase [Dietzia massiliensis]|nr:WSD1 family O-acyltransferase [Dietzia massiliensis]